jgi:uncharacterized protein YozE (UPF0346 family)
MQSGTSRQFANAGKPKTFRAFLKVVADDPSPIGDFATDALGDRSFPRAVRSFERLENYLLSRGACTEAIEAAKDAWAEFTTRNRNLSSPIAHGW